MKITKILAKILLVLTVLSGFGCAYCADTKAIEERNVIRVGLSNNNFSTYEFTEASFISNDSINVTDMASGYEIKNIAPQTEINVRYTQGNFVLSVNDKEIIKNAKGPLVIISKEKIGIINLNRKGNPAYYRGLIALKSTANEKKFNIINILDMQTYLKGVVPNEMPVSFGLSALKAQAVAARNYANRPQNTFANYDICDSTACQVYYGANSQRPISDRAVDETLGIYALYNKQPILALYSSTAGGITEDYGVVYGNGTKESSDKPYLKSVIDNKEIKKPQSENEIKEFYTQKIPSFDMKSPRYRWRVTFDRNELEDTLNKTLKEQSARGLVYPKFTDNDIVEGIEDIKVIKRGESAKAVDIEIKAVSGSWRVKKELGIRRVFKKGNTMLYSGNFFVEKSYDPELKELKENIKEPVISKQKDDVISENRQNESVFSYKKPEITGDTNNKEDAEKSSAKTRLTHTPQGKPLPKDFTFVGGGFGHGVGMSQYGAGYLSSYGAGYDVILKHYYSGITLGTMPKTVYYNSANIDYIQNLYFDTNNTAIAGQNISDLSSNPLKKKLLEFINATNKTPSYILNIDNSKRPSGIDFYVNSYHFTPDMKSFNGKILKMDITKYLKKGKNTILFKPLNVHDKDKTAVFWVEIEK